MTGRGFWKFVRKYNREHPPALRLFVWEESGAFHFYENDCYVVKKHWPATAGACPRIESILDELEEPVKRLTVTPQAVGHLIGALYPAYEVVHCRPL